jgi:Ser/Thr protein kinase RdoA (MazF antagonist)
LLLGQVDRVPARLAPWRDHLLPLQPCLCDVWHDHVLFEDEAVTGLVDYGSAKVDYVAADLARLLGSLVGDDPARRAAGLAAYTQLRPLAEADEALVTVLDETGTLLGAANWLRWLYRDGRAFEDRGAVAGRLAEQVRRIEQWR